MRPLFTTLFSVILFFTVQSQSNCDCSERLSNLAELKFFEGELDSALITYKRALSFIPENKWDKFDYYQLAKYYSANRIIDSTAFYTKKAVQSGYNPNYIIKNKSFETLVSSDYWNEIKDLKPCLDNFDWEYYNAITQMIGADQAIRNKDQLGKWANDSIYYLMDSINFYTLKKLISEHGLPTVSTHGFHINTMMILLMHASMYSDEMFKEVLEILYQANKEYLIDKGFIAMFIDRRLIWHDNDKQQIGTWNYSKVFNPINDLSQVDSLRFKYNLLNLEDYAKIQNMELPVNYIKTTYPKNYFCE